MKQTRPRTLVCWQVVRATFVCAHADEAPGDDEWTEMKDAIRKGAGSELTRILVFTYGGAPNANQRVGLNELLKRLQLPVAVLTPSVLARGAGTALHWFNPLLRVFEADDVDGALTHIGCSSSDRPEIVSTLSSLKAKVGRR